MDVSSPLNCTILLQVKGMNAVFNLKMEMTVGESLLTGVSVRITQHHTLLSVSLFHA